MKFRYKFLFSSFVSLSLLGCSIGEKSDAGVVKPFNKVGAVHGRVGTEIATSMVVKDYQVSQTLQLAADTNFETVIGKITNSSWVIPLSNYLANLNNVSVNAGDTTRSAEEWLNMGDYFYRCQQYEEAVASFDKAIQIKPEHADAWYRRGAALAKLKRYEDAIASFDKVIQFQPAHADALFNRGVMLIQLQRYEDALASFDKLIQIQPNEAEVWLNRGAALAKLKRYEDAVASFDKAIQVKPNDANVWFNRGFVLHLQERNKEALESVEKALEINPNLQQAQKLRQMILQPLGR